MARSRSPTGPLPRRSERRRGAIMYS
jgi:hypothetical protein